MLIYSITSSNKAQGARLNQASLLSPHGILIAPLRTPPPDA